jgi:glycosyltransferase involved in cell wall biosynthesis
VSRPRSRASDRSLRIAWLGAGPGDTGGVPGVATELLCGLAARGHRIDCFLPGTGFVLPKRVAEEENVKFVWGTSEWRWNRWYNRTKIGVFLSGLFTRALASVRLRREVERRHEQEPYDLIYQFSNIEALAMPTRLRHSVPLVMHPETHIAGELRFLISERRLSLRCQPAYTLLVTAAVMSLRVLIQRVRVRRARLLICISSVFRDHLVHDYGFPLQQTVVVPNPVRLDRFADADPQRGLGSPPVVLVLGRIAVRKGVEDVIAVARLLLEQDAGVRIRVTGGPSLWSDYTKLLDELPSENSEYAGRVPPTEIPAELAHSDLLLQASKYEPFALTVAEALAAGLPVVATSEVGAIEGVDRAVVGEVAPGDVEAMASAIVATVAKLSANAPQMRSAARAEAERLFAPELVCEQISDALEALVEGRPVDLAVHPS